MGYLEMIYLLDKCKMVITDSGGLQKEAYFFNKYCITLRDSTEWVELLQQEVNELMPINKCLTESIFKSLEKKIDNSSQLFGNGSTSKSIVNMLKS